MGRRSSAALACFGRAELPLRPNIALRFIRWVLPFPDPPSLADCTNSLHARSLVDCAGAKVEPATGAYRPRERSFPDFGERMRPRILLESSFFSKIMYHTTSGKGSVVNQVDSGGLLDVDFLTP